MADSSSALCYNSSSLCNFSVTSTTTDNEMSTGYNLSSGFGNTSQVKPFRTVEKLDLHNAELLTRRDTHANKSVWCHFVMFTMGIKAIYINRPQLQCCLWEDFHTRTSPVKISIIACSEFTSECEYKLTMTIWGKSFWTTKTTWSWSSRRHAANSKRSFNSSLEGTQLDVWCEKTPGQSEREQNSRLTLSHWAPQTLSHNSSPAVISSSSLPCHPLFFSALKKAASRWRERLKPRAKNNRQHWPREADIPRTSTSSARSSVGPVWGQYFETWVRNE